MRPRPANVLRMAEDDLTAKWRSAIEAFLRELGTSGASPHTLRAYRNDLGELARWAGERGLEPWHPRPQRPFPRRERKRARQY